MKYSEFCNAMCPVDAFYAKGLNKRGSNKIDIKNQPRDICFCYCTRDLFQDLLKTHLQVEVAEEKLRQLVNDKPHFNVFEAFKFCDVNHDNIITENEIGRLLESRGIDLDNHELHLLMEKFDKDRDGKISYNEFMEEVMPKSPHKAI
jgi:hypothetical protein